MDPNDLNRREFLTLGGAALSSSLLPKLSTAAAEERPIAQRLTWAGVKLEYKDTALFIDPFISKETWGPNFTQAIVPLESKLGRNRVLLTHMHGDHFDQAAIQEIVKDKGVVYVHRESATFVASRGFRTWPLDMYEPGTIGSFIVAAVPAMDASNDFQTSWIIKGGGLTFGHFGDTMFHGNWWRIGQMYGPLDVAFVPINGFIALDKDIPSGVPGSMTPEQAVSACKIMGAKLIVPIHHGFNDPGTYEETPNMIQRFKETADKVGIKYKLLEPGDWLHDI